MHHDEFEQQTLGNAAEHLLTECRMVLPGIQTLFGFQLIAVFNPGFSSRLDTIEQYLHLLATGLIAVAIALIMTPAAYHRQTGIHQVTNAFLVLSTRLLLCSMLPLALGICIDFYLVVQIVVQQDWISGALATGLFAVFLWLWLGLPWLHRRRAGKG